MRRIQVTTASRLHFGLLRLPPRSDWPDDGTRYFGGAGLMIAEPRVEVTVETADSWQSRGPHADRALAAAQRFATAADIDQRFRIVVRRCPPEHIGLGVGTQMELAVGNAIGRLASSSLDPQTIARMLGRGRRSGIGVAGFSGGGFLIDGGKRKPDEISIVRRSDWPRHWTLLLLTPRQSERWHGDRESAVFQALGSRFNERMSALLTNVIPAAMTAQNIGSFGQALCEYNSLAGEYFREVQSGLFSSPFVEELVHWLRVRGAAAAGQSSWGPTVFSVWDRTELMSAALLDAQTNWSDRLNAWNSVAADSGAAIEEAH